MLPRKRVKDKRISLNMNIYRNLHPMVNNQAKIIFKELMRKQIEALPKMNMIAIRYRIFANDKRKFDTSNIGCVVDKFLCDALTEFNIIPEDTYEHVVGVSYVFGGVDPHNGRVEATIDVVDKPFYSV